MPSSLLFAVIEATRHRGAVMIIGFIDDGAGVPLLHIRPPHLQAVSRPDRVAGGRGAVRWRGVSVGYGKCGGDRGVGRGGAERR